MVGKDYSVFYTIVKGSRLLCSGAYRDNIIFVVWLGVESRHNSIIDHMDLPC